MAVKRRLGRDIAVVIIMGLLGSLPMHVSAEDVSHNNESAINKLTANVETDIFQVVMPTETEGIFDFILDPQRLINETDGAMYNGKSFEKDCTVFFRRSDGKSKKDYSCKSDSVAITNKSTMPVEVSLEVKVDPSSLEGIVMTEDSAFKKDKSASLYLAVVDGKKEVPVGKDGVIIHKIVEAAPDGAYEYAYNSETEKYEYRLKKDIADSVFEKYSFQLTGAANEKGDWAAFTKAVPKILVTWKVFPKENQALRKDAVFDGSGLETVQGNPEQENMQLDQDAEEQPGGISDNTGTKQEKSEEVSDEAEKNTETDNGETEEGASDLFGNVKEEKIDVDTEGLVGE